MNLPRFYKKFFCLRRNVFNKPSDLPRAKAEDFSEEGDNYRHRMSNVEHKTSNIKRRT